MADMILWQAAMTGLKAATDIAVGLNKLKTMTEVNAKAIELQQVILNVQSTALNAQSEQAAMVEEIRDLKAEIARVKAWETQKQRYKLTHPWEGPVVVYALKESMSAGETAHWICTHCYEDGRRSILQPRHRKDAGQSLACPACKGELHYAWFGSMPDMTYAPE